jgi:hypothetical protein
MKDIAFKDNTIAIEQLPFPTVYYPGFYGAFFGFKKDESQVFFCSCTKEAIENYLKLRLSEVTSANSNPNRMFILSSMYFPQEIVESLKKRGDVKQDNSIIQKLNFENKICHECNKVIPSYRYCHEMYGGTFKQNYGWYINKQAFEWGIQPISYRYLPDDCQEDLLILLEDEDFKRAKKMLWESSLPKQQPEAEEQYKIIQKHRRTMWNVIENEVRRKFGHKKVGEAWTSETILFYIIQTLFPDKTILRHYRPSFLKGLELDIFIKEFNLGIEYQGIQHFEPVDHWGGEDSLEELIERDKKKKRICDMLGVSLIYFYYDEGLSNDIVLAKIKEVI